MKANTFSRNVMFPLLLACCITGAKAEDFTSSMTPPHSGDSFLFTLSSDSVVSLVSTLSGALTCGNSGFGITASDQADVVRSSWCHLGQTEGPWPLKAGSYYLNLWNNNWSTGNYTASLTISPQGNGDSEPNDTVGTATTLPLDTTLTGHLGFYNGLGDPARIDSGDYYRLSLPSNGILSITASKAATYYGTIGYTLYASDGETVVRDTSVPLDAGTYYLQVTTDTYYGGYYGIYTVSASLAGSTTGAVVASASSLTFSNQEVGTSTSQTITLTNNGSAAATLSSISASGDFSASWNTCSSSLAAGASCTLSVAFTPTTTGTRTGTLAVTANGTTISVSLAGTGMVTTNPSGSIVIYSAVTNAQSVSPTLMFVPPAAERNGNYNLYVAGLYQGQFYFVSFANGQLSIVPYTGGDFPVYQTFTGVDLHWQQWQIPLGDLSSLHGLEIYAGFGRSADDMLAKNQVQLIYTVQ